MQIALYSVMGALILFAAWAIPGRFITSPAPRIVCGIVALVLAAYFLPTPSDDKVAFFSGQYSFAGALLLAILWYAIGKARHN